MNWFEKLLYILQGNMKTPTIFGWYHILWVVITLFSIIGIFFLRKRHSEKQLKIVLGIYGITTFLLELFKQLIWSFNYDAASNVVSWDYQWYAFPFQFCTVPLYISLICLFLKDGKIRNALLSNMAFITIIGGLITMFYPVTVFVPDTLINIHTMFLHCGGIIVSCYLLITKTVQINWKNLRYAFYVFLVFVGIAQFLNIVIYQSGLLKEETFNMFYVSPYFNSSLPVFGVMQESLPFIIFFLAYIVAVGLCGVVIYYISYGIKKLFIKYLEP